MDEYLDNPDVWQMRTSYPGQPVAFIKAPSHIVRHYMTKSWRLPFADLMYNNEVLEGEPLRLEQDAYRLRHAAE
jgi:hypothetical protein